MPHFTVFGIGFTIEIVGYFVWRITRADQDLISQIIPHAAQRIFFQAADLGLGNADLISNFHLGPAFIKAKFDNVPFTFSKTSHGIPQGNVLDPVLFFIFFVTDLIHNIKGIAAFGIYRLKKAHRALDRIHGVDDHFFVNADFLSDLRDRRLF